MQLVYDSDEKIWGKPSLHPTDYCYATVGDLVKSHSLIPVSTQLQLPCKLQ